MNTKPAVKRYAYIQPTTTEKQHTKLKYHYKGLGNAFFVFFFFCIDFMRQISSDAKHRECDVLLHFNHNCNKYLRFFHIECHNAEFNCFHYIIFSVSPSL